MRGLRSFLAFFAMICGALGCGGGGVVETGNPKAYVSSSNAGDLSVWKINTDSSFTTTWSVTASGTGTIQYIYDLSGACQAANEFGFRPCTLTAASCQGQAVPCPTGVPAIGDAYKLYEVPGVLLLAYATVQNQLHIGIEGDCGASPSDDYVNIRTGIGVSEIFGMYRMKQGLTNLLESGFRFVSAGVPTLFYNTTDGAGTGAVTAPTSTSCENGVQTLNYNGFITRTAFTASGLFIQDYPYPLGGAFGFKSELAASIGSLASHDYYGYIYPEGGTPTMAHLTTGALNGGQVPFLNLIYQTGSQPSVTGHALQPVSGIGSAYGFNGVPPGFNSTTYATNILSATYPTPSTIPGVFVDQGGSSANNFTIWTAMTSSTNGKVLLFGATLDLRSGVFETVGTATLIQQ